MGVTPVRINNQPTASVPPARTNDNPTTAPLTNQNSNNVVPTMNRRDALLSQTPQPMPSREGFQRLENQRLRNLPTVVPDNGGVKISNMPRVYQHNPTWNDDVYRGGQDGLLGDLGCTYSAIAMGLGVYGVPIDTRDVNNVNDNVRVAVNRVNIRDLSGDGGNIGIGRSLANWNERVRITQMNPPRPLGSADSNRIMEEAKNSVRNGKPVLLGFRGNGTDRHSVTAIGVSRDGNLLVLDPWKESAPGSNKARYIPLNDVIRELGYTQLDYAYEFSRK